MIKKILVLTSIAAICGVLTARADDASDMQKSAQDAGNKMSKDAQQASD